MSSSWGMFCAVVAAVMYGLQYTPVKAYPVYDGLKFQWYMSCGIVFSGFTAAVLLNPPFEAGTVYVYPHGIVGGCLWGCSNVLTLPTVKLLGLGVGFAMYHSINMAVGYAIGRFGLFGAPRDVAMNATLRDGGLVLLLVSLVFMIYVEPEIHDLEEAVKKQQSSASQTTTSPSLSPQKEHLEDEAALLRRRDWLNERSSLLAKATKKKKQQHASSTGALDELSTDRGQFAMRRAYKSWRRGGARGAVSASTGVGGSREPATRRDTERRVAARSRGSWPLLLLNANDADATVHSHYRQMISTRQQQSSPSLRSLGMLLGDEEQGTSTAAALSSPTKLPEPRDLADDDEVEAAAKLTPARRFAIGGTCGVFAGGLCGLNMLPYSIFIAEHRGEPIQNPETLNYFFSQCLGVFVAATACLFAMTTLARCVFVGVEIKNPALWPAWIAGTLWAAGFLFSSVAVAELGMAEAYTFDAIGPVILSACISYACGEIVGLRNKLLFLVALAAQFLGVIAIVMGD